MTGPISNSIQNINTELDAIINQANSGKINEGQIFQTEFQLQQLLNNKDLPPDVKDKLQQALKELKGSLQNGELNLGELFKAQFDLNQAKKDLPPQ